MQPGPTNSDPLANGAAERIALKSISYLALIVALGFAYNPGMPKFMPEYLVLAVILLAGLTASTRKSI